MAKIAKKTKRYPSDLTDEEWSAVGNYPRGVVRGVTRGDQGQAHNRRLRCDVEADSVMA